MSGKKLKPTHSELLLARLLSVGTCVASAVIAVGLALSWFNERAAPPVATQLVTDRNRSVHSITDPACS